MSSVKALCGSVDLNLAKKCLASLKYFCSDKLTFSIHSDGTIDDQELHFLDIGLRCKVISLEEANDIVEPVLRKYRNIAAVRHRNAPMRKIIDIPIMTNGEFIDIVDTDVLAVRNFRALFPRPAPMHMRDHRNSYTVHWSRWHILRKLPILERVNVGLLRFRKSSYDMDYLNYLCGIDEITSGWHLEQTLWACLFARSKKVEPVFVYDDRQVMVVNGGTDLRDKEAVIFHFVGSCRGRICELEQPLVDSRKEADLRLMLSGDLHPNAFLFERFMHKMKRTFLER